MAEKKVVVPSALDNLSARMDAAQKKNNAFLENQEISRLAQAGRIPEALAMSRDAGLIGEGADKARSDALKGVIADGIRFRFADKGKNAWHWVDEATNILLAFDIPSEEVAAYKEAAKRMILNFLSMPSRGILPIKRISKAFGIPAEDLDDLVNAFAKEHPEKMSAADVQEVISDLKATYGPVVGAESVGSLRE
jgi:hypothetical protein